MRSRLILLSLTLLLLLSFSAGCGDIGCVPPDVDSEKAAEVVRGWVNECLAGRIDAASQYWSAANPEVGAQYCESLHNLTKSEDGSIGVELLAVEDYISVLCFKELWVTLRRNDDGRRGLLVVFVANGDSNRQGVIAYGIWYGPMCPTPDDPPSEFFDSCFWVAAQSTSGTAGGE